MSACTLMTESRSRSMYINVSDFALKMKTPIASDYNSSSSDSVFLLFPDRMGKNQQNRREMNLGSFAFYKIGGSDFLLGNLPYLGGADDLDALQEAVILVVVCHHNKAFLLLR